MATKRRRFTAEFTAKVVLEALRCARDDPPAPRLAPRGGTVAGPLAYTPVPAWWRCTFIWLYAFCMCNTLRDAVLIKVSR